STFAIAATEIGTTGHYTATIPGSTAGFRRRTWYQQAGGSPATTDTALGIEEGYWSGSFLDQEIVIDSSSIASDVATDVAASLSGHSLTVQSPVLEDNTIEIVQG